ncbi:MAG: cation-transporting P-type ATPase [Desulfomicrobium escambiense]|nr:cation-transporting P-type ATPase [Desulfomicrobium escambiense]
MLRLPCSVAMVRVVHMGKVHPRRILVPLRSRMSRIEERSCFVARLASSFGSTVTLFHLSSPLTSFFQGEVHLESRRKGAEAVTGRGRVRGVSQEIRGPPRKEDGVRGCSKNDHRRSRPQEKRSHHHGSKRTGHARGRDPAQPHRAGAHGNTLQSHHPEPETGNTVKVHSLTADEVIRSLVTSPSGLSVEEAEQRLREYGFNEITEVRKTSLARRFLSQFTHLLAVLLWVAAFLCFVSEYFHPGEGMLTLGWAIIAVIMINAVFTFVQEYRAERALSALRKLLPFHVKVLRDGGKRRSRQRGRARRCHPSRRGR